MDLISSKRTLLRTRIGSVSSRTSTLALLLFARPVQDDCFGTDEWKRRKCESCRCCAACGEFLSRRTADDFFCRCLSCSSNKQQPFLTISILLLLDVVIVVVVLILQRSMILPVRRTNPLVLVVRNPVLESRENLLPLATFPGKKVTVRSTPFTVNSHPMTNFSDRILPPTRKVSIRLFTPVLPKAMPKLLL